MKKRTAITAAMLAAALAVPATAMASEKTTIEFWHCMGGDNEALVQSIVDEYNASQDEVEVIATYQGGYVDSIAKVQVAIGAGNAPDILQTGSGNVSVLAKEDGVLENLVPYMEESGMANDFYEGFITGMGFDPEEAQEELLAFPMGCSTPVLYCNNDLLEAEGLSVPTTWDEMIETSQKLIEAGKIDYGFAIPHDVWYFWMFLEENGSNIFSEDGSTMECVTDGTAIEMWTKVQEMVQNKTMYFGSVQDNNCTALFGEGKTAFLIESIGALKSVGTNADFDFSVEFVPAEKINAVPTGGNTMCMLASSEKKEAAWDFMHWMYTENGGVATFSATIGYLPCSETVAAQEAIETKKEDPNYQKAFEQLGYANNEYFVRQSHAGDAINTIVAMMEATLYDFEDVTEQMNIMNEEVTEIMADLAE